MYKPYSRKSIHDPQSSPVSDKNRENSQSFDVSSSEGTDHSDQDDNETFNSLESSFNDSSVLPDDSRKFNGSGKKQPRRRRQTAESPLKRPESPQIGLHVKQLKELKELKQSKQQNVQIREQSSLNKAYIFCFLLLVVAGGVCIWFFMTPKSLSLSTQPMCHVVPLSDLFNTEEEIAIKTAIYDIQTVHRPSVLMLIYSNKYKDLESMNKRLQRLLEFATCKLNGGRAYVEIYQDELHSQEIMQDKGMIITKYRDEIKEKGVLLVRELQNTPAQVAMVFHYLCDQYTPVVQRAMFIFTLQFNEELAQESDFNIAEKVLMERWKDLPVDFLPPLIARLTNAIIHL